MADLLITENNISSNSIIQTLDDNVDANTAAIQTLDDNVDANTAAITALTTILSPSFAVFSGTATQPLSTTETQVTLDTADTDNTSDITLANNIITINNTGQYFFDFWTNWNSPTDSGDIRNLIIAYLKFEDAVILGGGGGYGREFNSSYSNPNGRTLPSKLYVASSGAKVTLFAKLDRASTDFQLTGAYLRMHKITGTS